MATLKEIKKRTGSAGTVHKITKAMKLVSASKSRSAQAANSASKPYSERITTLVQNLSGVTDPKLHPLLQTNDSDRNCFILVTPDKGLCGSLINNLETLLLKEGVLSRPADFIAVGKKGGEILLRHGKTPTALFEIGLRRPSFDFVQPIIKLFSDGYLNNRFGRVIVFYTSFLSSFRQFPQKRQILPALMRERELRFKDTAIFEPAPDSVLDTLLPRYLEIQFYQLILESVASEHSSRMVAMDKATTNAEGIIEELTLLYNKVRQEKITEELLEITTTMSAL